MANGQVMNRVRSYLLEPTFANVEGMAPDDVARRRALAQALWSESNSSRPVVGVFDGMNRVLQSFLGGRQLRQSENADIAIRDRADQQQQAGLQQMAEFAYPGQQSPSTAPAPSQSFNAGQADEWSTGDWPGGTGQQQVPASQQEFIDMMMPYAIEASQRTGIDPRIIIAQSAQETGWGRSAPGNNYFGIKSHGQAGGNSLSTTEYVNGAPVTINDSFRAYGSPAESVAGYADFMLQNGRYEPMRSAQGLDAQLAALGQSGYATDPGYANSVGQIARGINLPTANPTGEFVRGLIENPQTRPMAQALIEQEIARLTAPPAPVDPVTVAAGTDLVTPTGELLYANAPEPAAAPTTSDITNWQRAKADDGYTGTLQEWIASNRTPLVTVDQRGENAFAGAMGTGLANDVFLPMVTNGVQANQDLYLINRLDGLLGETGGGLGTVIARAAGNLGIPTGTTDAIQGAQAIIDYMVPRMRVPGSGSTSNFDAQTFRRSLPALMNQPGGNDIIIGTLRGMAEYQIAAGDIAMQVATGRLTPQDGLDQIGALPDPFAAFKATGLAETPAAATTGMPPTAVPIPGAGTTMEQRLTPQTATPAGDIPPAPAGVDPTEWPTLWQMMPPEDRALF